MDQGSNLYKTQQTLPILCRNRSPGSTRDCRVLPGISSGPPGHCRVAGWVTTPMLTAYIKFGSHTNIAIIYTKLMGVRHLVTPTTHNESGWSITETVHWKCITGTIIIVEGLRLFRVRKMAQIWLNLEFHNGHSVVGTQCPN